MKETDSDVIMAQIRGRIYERLDMSYEIEDEQLKNVISDCVKAQKECSYISIKLREKLERDLFNSIRGFDVLQELLEDDSITEIMINGKNDIFLEKGGCITKWDRHFESDKRLEDIAQKIAALSNRIVNESVPIVDTRLYNGSRVNIVLPPIAIDGPVITIRKFYKKPLTMKNLIDMGSISKEAAEFLEMAVRAKCNIFISGGTGSGKTTFLNILSNYIPGDERVITIEDSAELQLSGIDNLVRLEARNANVEGKNAVTIRELIRSSLRMRPDRIVVGEVRGGETLDMLQAMSTGHDGSLSTGHGNSPKDMMARLETMVLMGMDMPVSAIRQQIASAINIVVHLGRMRDKSRRVLEIVEIVGINNGEIEFNKLFEFRENKKYGGKGDGKEFLKKESNSEKVDGSLVRVASTVASDYKFRAAGIDKERYMPGA